MLPLFSWLVYSELFPLHVSVYLNHGLVDRNAKYQGVLKQCGLYG
jgi:hypothetical protein